MIDLSKVNEIKNVLSNKVIEKIEDEQGKIWYEAWKKLLTSVIPPLTLLKCKGVDLVDYKIYGDSVQQGKNLLPPLVKGVRLDFTTGEEKTSSVYASTNYIPINFNVNPNYYLSGLVNTINSCVYAYNKDKLFLGRTAGSGRTYVSLTKDNFTMGTPQGTGDIAYLRVSQYYNAGTSTGSIDDIDNAEIQLEIGDTATEYEPYKIPTPETPVEVESVGERTRNLFGGKFNEIFKLDEFIPANTTFYAFGDNLSGQCYIEVYDENKNRIDNLRLSSTHSGRRFVEINVAKDVYYVKFRTEELTNLVVSLERNPAYEPYGYRIPVKTSGKNLFNPSLNFNEPITQYGLTVEYSKEEDCFILNGTAQSTGDRAIRNINIPITKGSIFSISTKYVSGTMIRPNETEYVVAYFGASDTINSKANWKECAIREYDAKKENMVCNYDYITTFWFYISAGVTFDNYKVKIQLEENSITTDYEPYVEPAITNIYLKEPLRKTDDVVDYIDFKNQQLKSQIKEVVLDGSEKWMFNTVLTGVSRPYLNLPDAYNVNTGAIYNQCKCSHFDTTSNMAIGNRDFLKNLVYVYNKNVYFYTDPTEFPDLETWKEWLVNNNVTLQYKLAEENTTPIELPNIPTIKGTTILEIGTKIQPSNMVVIYKGK